MRRLIAMVLATLAALCVLAGGVRASALEKTAKELTADCVFSCSSNKDDLAKLRDGKHSTAWTVSEASGQYVQITLPDEVRAAGLYLMWNSVPEDWTMLVSQGGSLWTQVNLTGRECFLNLYVPLASDIQKVRIESESFRWKMTVAEIKVLGQGPLPEDVQVWQPAPEKADLMVIPAHPDDELIYFGGTLPNYAGQLKKHTVVVYMTSSPIIRKFEALDGLWKVGVREYPVFLPLANKYSSTVDDAAEIWDGMENAVSLVVEQLRRYKPDVVVTHDLNGEYGHGAHKLTALAVQKAVDAGGDAQQYHDSATAYGVWQVKKCYLHLYSKKKVEMDWREPLSAFYGKTALEMARAGYELHVSQHFHDRPIVDSGDYNNALFGLYYSSVGPDAEKDDLFENIRQEEVSSTQRPDAQPQGIVQVPPAPVTPAPSAPAVPAAADPKVALLRDMFPTLVAILLLVAAGLLALFNGRAVKSARHARGKP